MGEQNGARNAAPDAQSGAKSGAQDVTSDGTRATASQPPPPPPSRKSSRFIRATTATGPPQRRPGKAVQRATATGHRTPASPRQRTGSHAALSGTKVDAQDSWATRSGGLSFVSCKQIGPGCGASNSVS